MSSIHPVEKAMPEDHSSPKQRLSASFWRSLRGKFILVMILVQLAIMGLVTVVIEHRQKATILHESRKRALSLATSLAALSEGYLLSYDFVKLEQTVENLATEEDVGYAIVQLHDGKVAAYSGHPERQGQQLDDPVSQQALQAEQPLLQEVHTPVLRGSGYDVAVPVFAAGSTRKWGTVRVGLSLAQANQEIRTTSRNLFLLGIVAVSLGTGAAVFLALRISRPIQELVTGVTAVAMGNYDHPIGVISHDEVGDLAYRFEEMRQALRLHITHLADEKQRLKWANTTILATQEQLIHSEKLAVVGKIAAKVAHEVNNPLAVIKTSLHLINKRIPPTDPAKEKLDIIEEEIARIARTIREMLDFARPSGDITTLQVNEVIPRLMKFMAEDFASRGIERQITLASNLPTIRISLDQLKQVLLNLIKNATEAMPTGGTLRLCTARCPGGVEISVIDTGIGIPEAHLQTIFEPFFSTKTSTEGMGLGLAVCASIIKSYGGSIEASSSPGQGTQFRLFFPAYPPNVIEDDFSQGDTKE